MLDTVVGMADMLSGVVGVLHCGTYSTHEAHMRTHHRHRRTHVRHLVSRRSRPAHGWCRCREDHRPWRRRHWWWRYWWSLLLLMAAIVLVHCPCRAALRRAVGRRSERRPPRRGPGRSAAQLCTSPFLAGNVRPSTSRRQGQRNIYATKAFPTCCLYRHAHRKHSKRLQGGLTYQEHTRRPPLRPLPLTPRARPALAQPACSCCPAVCYCPSSRRKYCTPARQQASPTCSSTRTLVASPCLARHPRPSRCESQFGGSAAYAFIRPSRYFQTTVKSDACSALVITRVPRPRVKRPRTPSCSMIIMAASR